MTNLPKRVYPMISFYADSRRGYVNDNTVLLIGQRLQTVFDDWTQNHNVRIGEQYIMGLNGHVLQVWFNQFRVGRKPSTINNYVSFVNPFLRWAYKIGYIPDDISGIIKVMHVPTPDELPPEERPVDKYMTHDDVNRLLTAVDNGDYALRNKAMIALILFSGVRVSELCSLKLKSVLDCPQGYLYCRRKGGRWCYVNVAEEFYPYLTEYLATRDDLGNREAPLFTVMLASMLLFSSRASAPCCTVTPPVNLFLPPSSTRLSPVLVSVVPVMPVPM